jgi:hypothetical protein
MVCLPPLPVRWQIVTKPWQIAGVALGGTCVEVLIAVTVYVAVGGSSVAVFVGGTGVFVGVEVEVAVGVATVQGTCEKFN